MSSHDPKNIRAWSGTIYHMRQALGDHCEEVVDIGPVKLKYEIVLYYIDKLMVVVFGKAINFRWTKLYSYLKAKTLNRQLGKVSLDVIFCPTGTDLPCILKKQPIVYAKDGSFSQILDYRNNQKVFSYRRKQIINYDRQVYRKVDRVITPTQWARDYMHDVLKVDQSKIIVQPFGANLPKQLIPSHVNKVFSGCCNLLFVGVDWYWKGGDVAYQTLVALLEKNINVNLTVCGCIPPSEYQHDQILIHPFLDKNNQNDLKALIEEYKKAHFLLFPTREECFGVIVCEASAFGVPTLAACVDGVSGAVHDGINGYLFSRKDTGDVYASCIERIMRNKESYYALSRSTKKLYDEKLNWDVWAKAVRKEMKTLL